MKVKVIVPKDNFKLNIPVPLGLIANHLTCSILANATNKNSDKYVIDGNQLYKLVKCLKESKKTFGHYTLVDVETSDGEIVKIEI